MYFPHMIVAPPTSIVEIANTNIFIGLYSPTAVMAVLPTKFVANRPDIIEFSVPTNARKTCIGSSRNNSLAVILSFIVHHPLI